MKDLGERIKEYRTSMKMTQADFACRLGVTGASVSAYENGTRLPSYDILIRIANILGVSTDSLLGRRGMGSVTLDVSRLTQEQREVSFREQQTCLPITTVCRAAAYPGKKRSKRGADGCQLPFLKRKRELHLCSSLGAYRVQSAEEKDWEASSTPAASK
ncbi:MAG: helix-turn-helix domain-containing protein [Flavonifractor plautii]